MPGGQTIRSNPLGEPSGLRPGTRTQPRGIVTQPDTVQAICPWPRSPVSRWRGSRAFAAAGIATPTATTIMRATREMSSSCQPLISCPLKPRPTGFPARTTGASSIWGATYANEPWQRHSNADRASATARHGKNGRVCHFCKPGVGFPTLQKNRFQAPVAGRGRSAISLRFRQP